MVIGPLLWHSLWISFTVAICRSRQLFCIKWLQFTWIWIDYHQKIFFSSQNKLTTRMTGKKIFHNLILLHRDTQEYWLNQKFDWLFLSRLEIYVQSSQNILFQHFISSIKPTLLFHIEGTVERWENRSPICPICQQIKSLNLKWVFSVAILSKQTT